MGLIKNEYVIQGKYALMTRALCDKEFNRSYFRYYVELLMSAPLLGLILNKTGDLNIADEYKKVTDCTVFLDQLNKNRRQIEFVYKLIILNDRNEPDFKKRIDTAFRHINNDDYKGEDTKRSEDLYRKFLYGGIEVLYNTLIGDTDLFNITPNTSIPMAEKDRFDAIVKDISKAVNGPYSAHDPRYEGLSDSH